MEIISTVGNLKSDITEQEGQRVIVKKSSARGKIIEKEGVIGRAYSNFFRVTFDEKIKNETYSYSDIITNTVQVEIYNGNDFVPVVPIKASYKNKAVAIV